MKSSANQPMLATMDAKRLFQRLAVAGIAVKVHLSAH